MKTENRNLLALALLALLSTLNLQPSTAFAQGTVFTYQGRLNASDAPANGVYDFDFALFGASSGGSLIGSADFVLGVPVSNGLFIVSLDFGANFPGAARWLEIAVRTNGAGIFTTLTPRQPLTATPYAITAGSVVSGGGLSGVWKIGGNAGTSDDFIGTTDDTAFNIRVNNARVMRYRLATDAAGIYTNAPNVIGGSSANSATATVVGATIAGGGGNFAFDGSTVNNKVTANFGTVGGGEENTASGDYATISGGRNNTASHQDATVCGGEENKASGFAATVCGGFNSTASGDYSMVLGGQYNVAAGGFSFAGGYAAQANHEGCFVWSGNNFFPFASTTANQFRVRAIGGVAFVTAIDGSGSATAGVHLLAGDTTWSSISDKNAKKDFAPVNYEAVLDKLARVPIEQWRYQWESDTNTPHLGPMAQDFKAAFYPGRDDKSISTLEFDGVELAAIQGLNQKLTNELKRRDAENAQLKQRLERLEQLLNQKNVGDK